MRRPNCHITSVGMAYLVAGKVRIADPWVTETCRIMVKRMGPPFDSPLYVSAREPNESFTITSSNGADDGKVGYETYELDEEPSDDPDDV